MTPTARSLEQCRKNGWLADVVERRIPHSFITKDFLGFVDIIAVGDGKTMGIQTTSGSNHAARVRKIITERQDAARAWLGAGNLILVWSWSKRRNRFLLRQEQVTADMLGGE